MVVRFLRRGTGITPQVLVALHRVFVDPRMVARLLDAYRSGAPLARNVPLLIDEPRWLMEDAVFAWGPPQAPEDAAAACELEAHAAQLEARVDAELATHHTLAALRATPALPPTSMWQDVLEALRRARASLPESEEARAALHDAELAFARCHRRLYDDQ